MRPTVERKSRDVRLLTNNSTPHRLTIGLDGRQTNFNPISFSTTFRPTVDRVSDQPVLSDYLRLFNTVQVRPFLD